VFAFFFRDDWVWIGIYAGLTALLLLFMNIMAMQGLSIIQIGGLRGLLKPEYTPYVSLKTSNPKPAPVQPPAQPENLFQTNQPLNVTINPNYGTVTYVATDPSFPNTQTAYGTRFYPPPKPL